nr:MAG TPA: Repressor protein CI [Caudoviricetes sp.]
MNETTQRLFQAAKDLKNINLPSELARFLNVSQQVIKNWETRGVSAKMIPEVSERLGISERWLRTGEGEIIGLGGSIEMSRLDKVKELIEKRFNGSQAEFARAIEKAPAQVNQWLNGYRNIGNGAAAQIEDSLSLPRGWLDSQAELKQPESNASILGLLAEWDNDTPLLPEDCEVPLYKEIRLSAGNGFSDDIADYNGYKLRFSKSTLRRRGINPTDVVCVCADGNSMEPVFPDCATLGINTADKVIKDGKIYAVNHGGLLRTKILQKLPNNKIRIKSYNSEAYPDEEVAADEMNIIGRVFWWSVLD